MKCLGDVSMATVGTPVPPPVKNEWLSSALDPRLSPPSPGGPRKATPMTTVSSIRILEMKSILNMFCLFRRQ